MKAQVYRNSTPEINEKLIESNLKLKRPLAHQELRTTKFQKKSKPCKISDDESDTDDTVNNNMLRLDHKNETSGHSD